MVKDVRIICVFEKKMLTLQPEIIIKIDKLWISIIPNLVTSQVLETLLSLPMWTMARRLSLIK